MKYIIGINDIDWSTNRWEKCIGVGEQKTRKGYIGLYDRNRNKFMWFKIIKKCVDKFAFLCERNAPITGYWKNTLDFNSQSLSMKSTKQKGVER